MERYYNLFTVTYTTCYPTVSGCPASSDPVALESLKEAIRSVRGPDSLSSVLEVLETDRHGALTQSGSDAVFRIRGRLS